MTGPRIRAVEQDLEEGQGTYLYCFTWRGALDHCSLTGIDDRALVETLEVEEVAAVFSVISVEEFQGQDADRRSLDPNWLMSRVCRHVQIIEAVMARASVLPVRFGALTTSRQAITDLLTEHQNEIAEFLRSIAGKEEWSVKVFLDMDRAGAWLLNHDPELANQRRRLPVSPGARYFQEKRFRAEVRRQAMQWAQIISDEVREQLRLLAGEVRPLRLQGGDEPTKEMVFHGAVLASRHVLGDLQQRLEELRKRYADAGVTLESSGPWPPYSFCPAWGNRRDETPRLRNSS